MHLGEGASGVLSRGGMAKTERCGGKVGCGCLGQSNVRAEATGWKAGQALKRKRSCASPHWGKQRCLYLQRRGGPVRPSCCLSSTSSPSSCTAELDTPARPALSLAKLHCHSPQAQKTQNSAKGGTSESYPLPRHRGLG